MLPQESSPIDRVLAEVARLNEAREPTAAFALLDSARKAYGDDPQLLFITANMLRDAGMLPEAVQLYRQITTAIPDAFPARNNCAHCLMQLHRYEEARGEISAALAGHQNIAELWITSAAIEHAQDQLDAAEICLRRALKIAPDHFEALGNLAEVLSDQERLVDSVATQEKALALRDHALVRFNMAHNLFKLGRLDRAWKVYEARFEKVDGKARSTPRLNIRPRWNGQSLSGSLLVWMEQGVGEEILYASLLSEAAECCRMLIVECDPRLVPLFVRSMPHINFVPRQVPPLPDTNNVAAQIPAASMGALFRTKWEDFPQAPSYLRADENRVAQLRAQYHAQGDRVIGISWRSKPRRFGDYKTTALEDWAPILSMPGHVFLNLQYGDTVEDMRLAAQRGWNIVHDPAIDPLKSLDDFAAQVAACDRVISFSNTMVHVAGALGVPCDVLVPAGKDAPHHWFHRQTTSPWYPSLRLRWQTQRGKWDDVIAELAKELKSGGA